MNKEDLTISLSEGIKKINSISGINNLKKIAESVPDWLTHHFEMEHSTPSPSSILRCRLQQWYYAKGVKVENDIPLSWTRRAAIGIMAESYWYTVFNLSGNELIFPPIYKCGPHMKAHPDALLKENLIPVEFKDKTGFQYQKLIEGVGLANFDAGEYAQLQLYIYATNSEGGLYVATPADPQMLQTTMRQKKQYGDSYNLPPFYLEIIKRNDKYINFLLKRAEILVEDLKSNTPPTREYPGAAYDQSGRKKYPCFYCPFIEKCQEEQGIGIW